MIKETIEAYDKDGTKLGEQVEDRPETFAELVEQFEEKDIVTLTWRSHVIDVQRELRAAVRNGQSVSTKAKVNRLIEEAKKLGKDSSLYQELVRHGIMAE